MSNETEFMNALAGAGGPPCDDCLAPAAGWNQRQQANQVGRRLEARGVIARPKATCVMCHKIKTVSAVGDSPSLPSEPPPVAAQTRSVAGTAVAEPPAGAQPWHWEGNVQAAIAAHLASTGWRLTQVVDTASKAQGVDVIAQRNGLELWVTVKGYPKGTERTNPSTQSRHWFSHAMFDVVRYRTKRPDVAIGVGLPDGFTTYLNLAPTVEWLHASAPFVFYWAGEDGEVREV